MNKDAVLDYLIDLLSLISYHLDLPAELVLQISGSGYESKFFALLSARLRQLSALGIQATVMKEFEPLGGGLYSMHLAGKGFNIRILYGFLSNGQPALLHAFYERAGKNQTDYSTHIPVALSRLAQVRKEFDYEN